jgi:hypothetical protein
VPLGAAVDPVVDPVVVLLEPEVVLLDPTLELLPQAVAIRLRANSSTEVWRRRDPMALIICVPLYSDLDGQTGGKPSKSLAVPDEITRLPTLQPQAICQNPYCQLSNNHGSAREL